MQNQNTPSADNAPEAASAQNPSATASNETGNSSAALKGIYALCVRRPVLAIVLNLLLVTAGIAAFFGIELREMPNIDRPVVTVTTTYSGATPEVVDAEVTSMIEKAVARTSGIASISSSSRYGRSRITIEFLPQIDLSEAVNDVRDAVSSVTRRLPDDAESPVVVKADADASPVMRLVVSSSTLPIAQLTKYVEDVVTDRLAAIDGVASVSVYGARDPVFKIAVDLRALASRGLTLSQVRAVLTELAQDTSAGSLRTNTQDLFVRANADVQSAEDIANVRINPDTRIADVALVTYGPSRASSGAYFEGARALSLGVIRSADSNTIEISNAVKREVAIIKQDLPAGTDIFISSDDARFISGALNEAFLSIFYATGIVIAIIWLFLGRFRITLIPALTVPVALIGALSAIWMAGFSINVLTLLALLLATGMVVDDAIVVLENITKRIARGETPAVAAIFGTREVFFAVITTTATLAAVFIPISFLPGSIGKLFSEFGFVLAICVGLSSFVALTLAPMLAANLLKQRDVSSEQQASALGRVIKQIGQRFANVYLRSLQASLSRPLIPLAMAALFCLIGFASYKHLPQELTPQEDRAVILMRAVAPQGVSLEYTRDKLSQIETIIRETTRPGEAKSPLVIAGTGSLNSGFIVVPLSDWQERSRSQAQIIAQLRKKLSGITGINVFIFQPNTLGVRGAGQGLSFAVTGSNYDAIAAAAQSLSDAMQDRFPGKVLRARLSYDTTQPQLLIHVDRERAEDLGLSAEGISANLRMLLDGSQVAELFIGDDGVPLIMEAGGDPLASTKDLENIFVKTSDGTMLPLSSIITIEEEAVAPSLTREAQQRAVPVSLSLAGGYDLASAVKDLQATAAEVLPAGTSLTLLSEAALLEGNSANMLLTFAFAVLVVFLVLSAQFESFVCALIILLSVPFGVAAAFIAMDLAGASLNVYSQIGIILLVGLMAKNGILIVEFANQLRERGQSVADAIQNACQLRLRPIVMTVASTVLGAVPLVLAFGAGAEARVQLGWVIVGGLGFATLATMYLIPVAYRLLAGLSKPRSHREEQLTREISATRNL
ncbi:efflux RND transporter permease subunit [Polycladidibacter hongkongensis]|uniref:efflux RND transporter permease subunit n=1 Tax=Polycladidibacter hongkongensis TaxID=1647556 RepID=UPI0009EB6D7F|nr:efflux RND transporter permease subunit [Pseudovibrio hongkongensis]